METVMKLEIKPILNALDDTVILKRDDYVRLFELAKANVNAKEEAMVTSEPIGDIYTRISVALGTLGVKMNLKGYGYIERAIQLIVSDKEYKEQITKKLYPEIAKEFKTTPSRVERAIRHAIECVISSVYQMEKFNKMFKVDVTDKPTNSEFLAIVAAMFRK